MSGGLFGNSGSRYGGQNMIPGLHGLGRLPNASFPMTSNGESPHPRFTQVQNGNAVGSYSHIVPSEPNPKEMLRKFPFHASPMPNSIGASMDDRPAKRPKRTADSSPSNANHSTERYSIIREDGELSEVDTPGWADSQNPRAHILRQGNQHSDRVNDRPSKSVRVSIDEGLSADTHRLDSAQYRLPPGSLPNAGQTGSTVSDVAAISRLGDPYRPPPEPASPRSNASQLNVGNTKSANGHGVKGMSQNPRMGSAHHGPPSLSSIVTRREAAKEFIKLLHDNKITIDQLKHEDLDPVRLEDLYREAGLSIPSAKPTAAVKAAPLSFARPSTVQKSILAPQPSGHAPVPDSRKIGRVDRKEHIARLLAAKAKKLGTATAPLASEASTESTAAAPIVLTKDSVTAPSISGAGVEMQSGVKDSTKETSGMPERIQAPQPRAMTAEVNYETLASAAKKRAQTELARQKVEELNAARLATIPKLKTQDSLTEPVELRIKTNGSNFNFNSSCSIQPVNGEDGQRSPHAAPLSADFLKSGPVTPALVSEEPRISTDKYSELPRAPADSSGVSDMRSEGLQSEPGRPRSVIPGLFMTSTPAPSIPDPNAYAHSLLQQSPVISVNSDASNLPGQKPAANGRKRPVASDFHDDYAANEATSYKRPFGQARFDTLSEKVIIEPSDEGSSAGDGDDNLSAEGKEVSMMNSATATGGLAAFRDLPALSNSSTLAMLLSTVSSIPTSLPNTPGTTTPSTARDLQQVKRREEEILFMKRKIAELEQRQKVKTDTSRAQTPNIKPKPVSKLISERSTTDPDLNAVEHVSTFKGVAAPLPEGQSSPDTHLAQATGVTSVTRQVGSQTPNDSIVHRIARRAQIEADFPVLDASVQRNKLKLQELREQVEELEAITKKEEMDKVLLTRELENLSSDAGDVFQPQVGPVETDTGREFSGSADQQHNDESSSSSSSASVSRPALAANSATSSSGTDGNTGKHKEYTPDEGVFPLGTGTRVQEESFEDAMDISDNTSVSTSDSTRDTSAPDRTHSDPNTNKRILPTGQQTIPYGSITPDLGAIASPDLTTATAEEAAHEGEKQKHIHDSGVSSMPSEPESTRYLNVARPSTGPYQSTSVTQHVAGLSDRSPMSNVISYSGINRERAISDVGTNPIANNLAQELQSEEAANCAVTRNSATEIVHADASKVYDEFSLTKQLQFKPYESPLRLFKAYRYHPDYPQDVSGGFRSMTYSHDIDPNTPLCKFEAAGGACNDSLCSSQHFRKMSLSDDMVLVQLGTNNPGRVEEEKMQWTKGLKAVLNDLRSKRVKDPEAVATSITAYRREFLNDPSRVLNL